ncbi:nuclear transport factor 2 family protein [Vibrio quintilis]|uniref:SnoaL-like domain-containing protein n=1 Tax=Vibrio quintilis TaxID=1117707 RepID=A0A1M7YVE4_9VIBR|nr:nuclear transport factor 2 family protein [Vibrio quintilis]SHO56548.1 hypothetical protein VQ7734_02317 [Vibrio quintilis]
MNTNLADIFEAQNETERCDALCRLYRGIFSKDIAIEEIFARDYVQITDGKRSHFKAFCEHIERVLSQVQSLQIDVCDVCQQGDLIADRHRVTVVYHDGRHAVIEVFAFMRCAEGRLCSLVENTRVIQGDAADQSLASC